MWGSSGTPRGARGVAAVGVAGALVAAVAIFPNGAAGGRADVQDTTLLSSALGGDIPNGASREPVISQDGRHSRIIGFTSEASDIVAGDTNGESDVFAIFRGGSFSDKGEPWVEGSRRLISQGKGGEPANGPSYAPAVGGSPGSKPECIAFISAASNLVSGDNNGKPDAFLYDVSSRKIERVSVDADGKQSNGESFDVSVDGKCERVAFTSDASNLALTKLPRDDATKRAWAPTKTGKPKAGTEQVYVRILEAKGGAKRLKGLTFLASASNIDRPGSGDSYDVDFASGRGKAIAFTSTGRLAGSDSNGASDVFMRALDKDVSGKGSRKETVETLKLQTVLASATGNKAGNGASSEPSINDDGEFVAFMSEASSFGGSAGAPQVARTTISGGKAVRPTRISSGANGPSRRPITSSGGANAAYLSDASNRDVGGPLFPDGDRNGVPDAFVWSARRSTSFLQSKSSDNGPLSLPVTGLDLSARINYLPIVTASPFTDLAFVRARHPEWLANPAATVAAAAASPAFSQIYLRYLGPE